jgi:hypothetical protein
MAKRENCFVREGKEPYRLVGVAESLTIEILPQLASSVLDEIVPNKDGCSASAMRNPCPSQDPVFLAPVGAACYSQGR